MRGLIQDELITCSAAMAVTAAISTMVCRSSGISCVSVLNKHKGMKVADVAHEKFKNRDFIIS